MKKLETNPMTPYQLLVNICEDSHILGANYRIEEYTDPISDTFYVHLFINDIMVLKACENPSYPNYKDELARRIITSLFYYASQSWTQYITDMRKQISQFA